MRNVKLRTYLSLGFRIHLHVLQRFLWSADGVFLSFFLSVFLCFCLSLFLSSLVWPLLPTHRMCRGLLLCFITLNDHTHTHTHTHIRRTRLDEGSTCRRDLYLTIHNIYKRQTSIPPAGFEPPIPAGERPKTHALDRVASGIGVTESWRYNYSICRGGSVTTLKQSRLMFNACGVDHSVPLGWLRRWVIGSRLFEGT
jgi:hypothetical protein